MFMAIIPACSAASVQPDRGYQCKADTKIMSLSQGEVATFHGVIEATPDGWMALRFDDPVCMKLTSNDGKQIGPLAYDLLSIGALVDGRDQVELPPTGMPVAMMAEVDLLGRQPGDSPLLLRVLSVTSQDSPNREESE
jgi:hypothetical protein